MADGFFSALPLLKQTKSFAYVSNSTSTANASAYTFSSVSLGVAAPSRRIHVLIAGDSQNAATISSVTVGGVTATINAQGSSVDTTSGIATALVPTGTTGDIVVTFSAIKGHCNVGWYRSTGLSSNTAVDSGTSTADPGTDTLTSVIGGFALGVAGCNDGSATVAWTNLTENYDVNPESAATASGASATTSSTSVAPSADYSAGAERVAAFATF